MVNEGRKEGDDEEEQWVGEEGDRFRVIGDG